MSAPQRDPLVSVILPTYNRAVLLPRAVASVLNQSFGDFELIVVDDASTDDTEAVVRGFSDPRIIYYRAESNRGDAASRNAGAHLARGKYLAFQDSDDEWLPDKLERQVQFIESLPEDCALVASKLLRVVGRSIEVIQWPGDEPAGAGAWVNHARFLRGCPAYLQSMLVRRNAFEALRGFDEELPINSDWEFCLRVSGAFRIATWTQAALVVSHETEGSLSSRNELRATAMERIIRKHADSLDKDRAASGRLTYICARASLQLGRSARGRHWAWRALKADPLRLRHWLVVAASFLRKEDVPALLELRSKFVRGWRH